MPELLTHLAALASGLVLAWATGNLRKYGHHLERLRDLALKMPEGTPARAKLDEAVQREAERIVALPAHVGRALNVLMIFLVIAVLGQLALRLQEQGVPSAEGGQTLVGLLLIILFFLLPASTVLEYVVQSLIRKWRSRRPRSSSKAASRPALPGG